MYDELWQALLGGLFTWALTALGSAAVFFVSPRNTKLLDFFLGLAAGVMTAASFWSLLAPAIAQAKTDVYGDTWAFVPVTIGFLVGAAFVFGADYLIQRVGLKPPGNLVHLMARDNVQMHKTEPESGFNTTTSVSTVNSSVQLTSLAGGGHNTAHDIAPVPTVIATGWRRVLLLIIAITVHNVPEGLAVGVAFAAAHSASEEDYPAFVKSAMTLALGIGIQNFPEGAAVSLPLPGYGFSKLKSFFYGQLSGMVEPVFAVIGAALLVVARPILSYALAFGAGAMICVVYDDIVPEGHVRGDGRICSYGAIAGFLIMMILELIDFTAWLSN